MAKAAKVTLQTKFAKALEGRGLTRVPCVQGTKHILFRADDGDACYYVGRAGSVRVGVTKKRSIPISEHMRAALLVEYEASTKTA